MFYFIPNWESIGVKSHFSVGLKFECEFRASPSPSCHLSIHLHVPCWGQEPRCPELRPVAWVLGLAVPPKGHRQALT